MLKGLIKVLTIISMGILLFSCGDTGGGAEYFSTVLVTGSAAQGPQDLDVAEWYDVDSDNDTICDGYTIQPDNLKFNIAVTPKPELPPDIEASPIYVRSATISYTPLQGSPALSTVTHAVGVTIDAGTTGEVLVEILSQNQKGSAPLSSLVSSGLLYEYDVSVTFHLVEVTSEKTGTITVHQYIKVADFKDDCD